MSARRSQYLQGLHAGLPVVLGFVPVGIAFAVMARQAGFDVLHTCLMSLTVFAGASQMMAVGMYAQGAGLFAIITATFLLNLRHVIMSTCVMNRMRDGWTGSRLLAAFGVTDESFAIFTTQPPERCTLWYFLGMITVTYLSWNVGTLIGALASALLPAVLTASLGVALYAMFIGLLVPGLPGNSRLCGLVLLTAVCNSLLTLLMDASWALIVSTLVGALAGVFFVELDEEVPHD